MGVLFDNKFSQDISCNACFYHIWDIRRISKGLPLALAEQIAVALVTSKLDYCNSLLHKIPEKITACFDSEVITINVFLSSDAESTCNSNEKVWKINEEKENTTEAYNSSSCTSSSRSTKGKYT